MRSCPGPARTWGPAQSRPAAGHEHRAAEGATARRQQAAPIRGKSPRLKPRQGPAGRAARQAPLPPRGSWLATHRHLDGARAGHVCRLLVAAVRVGVVHDLIGGHVCHLRVHSHTAGPGHMHTCVGACIGQSCWGNLGTRQEARSWASGMQQQARRAGVCGAARMLRRRRPGPTARAAHAAAPPGTSSLAPAQRHGRGAI